MVEPVIVGIILVIILGIVAVSLRKVPEADEAVVIIKQGYLKVVIRWAKTWPFGSLSKKKDLTYFE